MDTEHGQSAPYDAAPPPPAAGVPATTPTPAATPEQPPAASMPASPPPPPPPPAHWPGWQSADWQAGQGYGPGGQGYGPAGQGYGPGGQGYGPAGQGYGPGGQGYGPAGTGYAPGGQGYAPAGTGYAPGGQGYGPAGAGYAPGGQGYGPAAPGYPSGYGAGGPAYPGGTGEAGRPGRRRRGLILAAAGTALALAAGGTAWVATAASSSPLSTDAIASRTDAGLVDVTSTLGYQQGTAEGTGMVLTSNGEVLTNNHVIDGATAVKVRDIGNGRTYTAKVVGYSETNDVAVLQLQGASGLSTVSIGSSTTGLSVGQRIVALGNALGKGGTPAVAPGQITGLGATITAEDQGSGSVEQLSGMIRTNAGIQPGDSGGPLVNSSGQVVGMDTAASSSNSGQPGTTAAVTTTAFAIPISRAISVAEQIEAGTASSTVHLGATAFLGVAVSSQSGQAGFGQASTGATIEGVVQGGPASQAGLAAGDTIESIGGHQIAAAADLHAVIEGYHPADKVSVTWIDQSGQSQSAEMTLAAGPAA